MVGADVEDLEDPGPSVALNHNDGHLRVFIRDCSPQAMPAMDNARAVQAAPLIGSLSAEFKQNHRVYNFLLYATARTNDLVLRTLKTSCVAGFAQNTAFAFANIALLPYC